MAAYVEHEFKRGFHLDEERLRKLHSVIRDRLKGSAAEGQLYFKVYRGDAYCYETDNLDTVLAEDNADWRRITRLDFVVKTEPLSLALMFSAKDGSEISIEGSDRDQVFLLFSDLREYLQEEVNLSRIDASLLSRLSMMLPLLVMMGAMVAAMAGMFMSVYNRLPSQETTEAAIASADLGTKLDFLIERYKRTDTPGIYSWLGAAAMVAAILLLPLSYSSLPRRAVTAIFPGNVFLFGSQKLRFERRRRLVSNIVRVVVIGFVVSLAGSLLVWYFTSRGG